MRAAVLREYGEPLEIADVDPPTPDLHGAVVAVEACGICRSDWHAWQGHGEWADDQVPLDFVLGHEPAGRVVAVGERVESVNESDHVAVPFNLGCGVCGNCKNGRGNVCGDGLALGFDPDAPGAFAEQVHVPHADYNVFHLPEGVDSREMAALGCRFATAFHALAHRAAIDGGDWIAVHGCGGVGLSTIHIAHAFGARPVAVDSDAAALSLATDIGATATVDASATDPVTELEAITDGGADVSIDALGRAETCRNSVRCLRQHGTHVQIGLTTDAERGEVSLPIDWMTRWEITWVGTRGMPPTRYVQLLSMLQAGDLAPGRLVNLEVGLEGVSDRLAAMTDHELVGVEIVRPTV